jgi:hypothetical protein
MNILGRRVSRAPSRLSGFLCRLFSHSVSSQAVLTSSPPFLTKFCAKSRNVDPISLLAPNQTENPSNVLSKIASGDYTVPIKTIEEAIFELAAGRSLYTGPVLSLRAGLLHYSRYLSADAAIVCLQLFADHGVPDHQFFKEIGKDLVAKVNGVSISQIASLLRSHATVGATESDLFNMVCSRLSSVVNRASLSTIRDVVHSLSLIRTNLVDSQRMIELCLNRYSLCIKDDSCIDSDKDILSALARLRINNHRIIRKIACKIASGSASLSEESLAEILGSLGVLDVDTISLWSLLKRRKFRNLSELSPQTLSDLAVSVGSWDVAFCLQAIANCEMRMSSTDEQSQYSGSLVGYKNTLGLLNIALTQPAKLSVGLSRLSFDELEAIQSMTERVQKTLELKKPSGGFIENNFFEFLPVNVSGVFLTNLAGQNKNTIPPRRNAKISRKIQR